MSEVNSSDVEIICAKCGRRFTGKRWAKRKYCGFVCSQSRGNPKHGMRRTRIYNTWRTMRQRTSNPRHSGYKWYGARGIKVCEQWENSFDEFKKWAEANGYRDELEIDRIDMNAGYSPENCRFVVKSVNVHNRRKMGDTVSPSSTFFGVSLKSKYKNPWGAKITHGGRQFHLGSFRTEIEAAKAYDAKAKELYGDFARLNFPEKT